MSGGHFDYQQYRINDIAHEIDRLVASGDYEPAEVTEFRKGIAALKRAAVYVQRIDWLVSGDDGPDSFHICLASDLKCIDDQERSDG